MGIYVNNILNLQTINPHKAKEFIQINELLLKQPFKDKQTPMKIGGGPIIVIITWVMVALCALGRIGGIPWRKLPEQMEKRTFLIKEGWIRTTPQKSTLYAVWRRVNTLVKEKWIITIGQQCSSSFPCLEALRDSSGVKTRRVCMENVAVEKRSNTEDISSLLEGTYHHHSPL